MPEIPDVAPGEVIESVWGNELRDRSLQRYADETERDFLNGAPIEGELAWIENINTMQVYNGADWIDLLDTDQSGFPWLSQTGGTLTGTVFFPAGSVSDPSIAFDGVPNTGISRSGTSLRLGSEGVLGFSVFDDHTQTHLPILTPLGSQSEPSVQFNSNLAGIYRVPGDILRFKAGGAAVYTVQINDGALTGTDANSETMRNILVGQSNPPSNAVGKDGDIYLRYA